MARWKSNAHGRLAEAALELYGKRGFDATTVAEIAKRAGLTERTFFRHFRDKREVLFWGASTFEELLVRALERAQRSLSAIDAVGEALETVAEQFPVSREYARRRQAIIEANPELQERERIKFATLASALAGSLRRRGVAESAATLAAEMGMTVYRIAFAKWIGKSKGELRAIVRSSLRELKAVISR